MSDSIKSMIFPIRILIDGQEGTESRGSRVYHKSYNQADEFVEQIKKVLRQKPKVEGITHYAVEIREAPMMRKNLSQISIFRN